MYVFVCFWMLVSFLVFLLCVRSFMLYLKLLLLSRLYYFLFMVLVFVSFPFLFVFVSGCFSVRVFVVIFVICVVVCFPFVFVEISCWYDLHLIFLFYIGLCCFFGLTLFWFCFLSFFWSRLLNSCDYFCMFCVHLLFRYWLFSFVFLCALFFVFGFCFVLLPLWGF